MQAVGIPKDENADRKYANFVKVGGRWEMRHRFYSVKASSTHAPEGGNDYEATNVRGYRDSAWAEGAAGDGIGESLTLTLDQPRKVSHIAIRNGLVKSGENGGPDLYYANNRVAELGVSVNGGKPFTATVPDEFLFHPSYRIPLPLESPVVKTILLTIQKVHRGTKYRDTCISGIELITPLSKKPKLEPVR